MACPGEAQTEWVELYNAGSTLTVTNWRITDRSNNYRIINGTLLAQSYGAFAWTGSLLNNTGDGFFITTDSGQLLDSAAYDSCTTGKSLILDASDNWVAATPSPGAANTLPAAVVAASPSAVISTTIAATPSTSSSATGVSLGIDRTPEENVRPPSFKPESLVLQVPDRVGEVAPELTANKQTARLLQPVMIEADPPAFESSKPWWLFFVIMAGLLFAASGLLPPYASAIKTS